ncbi:MAG: hypothetical protein LUG18_11585 [Candidatus Azobacteroides sp.]|nr:hypothetical protein [Candidatus Azobacteroides sp.]
MPPQKLKKKNVMVAGLLIYLAVIAYLAYPRYAQKGDFTEYFLVIGVTLVAIVILWFLQTFRDRYRNKMNNKNDGKNDNRKLPEE